MASPNPAEIIGWGTLIATVTGLLTKGIDTWLARRNKRDEEETKNKNLVVEDRKLSIERVKVQDAADEALIKALMDERKTERLVYQEEIKALRGEHQEEKRILRAEMQAERERCDKEMEKLRESCEHQIKAAQESNDRQIETLRGEIRNLISEVAELRAENTQLKREGESR